MKLFKNIVKVICAYAICLLFAYVLIIRVRQIDNNDKKLLNENVVEEYYVYDVE